MTNPTSLGDLTLSPTLDDSRFWADFNQLIQQVEREQGVKLRIDDRAALSATDRVKKDIEALGTLTGKQADEQVRNARVLGAQYQASAKAIKEQNAAAIASYRSQTAASRAEAVAAQERTARIREQQAQLSLTTRLAQQAAREEKVRSQVSITALSNEMVAYRNMWQARQISDQQLIEAQRRIHSQAILQAQAVDRTTDAYRRLTQVAAGAQRSIDRAEGINSRGGLADGVTQGIQAALGQFGVGGDLLAGFVQLIAAKRAAAVNTAEGLGSDTMAGLIRGMKSDQAQVKRTAEETAEGIEAAIRQELDIHSPSRVMEYLGQMVGDGFASGIRSRWADARRAAAGLSDAAQSGVNTQTLPVGLSLGGRVLGSAAGGVLDAGKVSSTSAALDGLNKQLQENAVASAAAATAGAATEVATEALGGAVEGAAEHIQSFTDARNEQDAAQREAALNDAKTALAFTAVAAAATAAAAAMVMNYNAARDYQTAMLAAQATTEATASQMRALDEVARSNELAQLGIDGIKAAAAVEELGSQGLNTTQIIGGGLTVALTLAKAVNTDVATSAAVAAASTKAFGLEAKDLARVGDVVTNAVNGTSVKIDSFSDAIAAGGSQARASGVDFATFTAVISLLTDKALGASDAGTAFKTFLMALTPNSAAAKAEMKRLNLEFFDAQGNMKSMGEIAGLLQRAFAKLTPEQRLLSSEIMFGSDGQRVYNALVEAGTDGLNQRVSVLDRAGKMTDAATRKLEGAAGAQEQFNASLKNFQIQAGQAFLPGISKVLNLTAGLLQNLTNINREYGKLLSGQAAFGAQTYDLPTWLAQTGLKQADLTASEVQRAQALLTQMQQAANLSAKNAEQWRKLHLEGKARAVELDGLRQIGQMGVALTALQRAIAARVTPAGQDLGNFRDLNSILQGLGVSGFGLSADYAGHTGKDVRTPEGTPLRADQTVRVTSGFEKGGYGQYLKLTDRDGYQMILAHLKTIDQAILDQIKQRGFAVAKAGDLLGTTGGARGAWYSQNSTGPHLHVEVRDPQGRVQNLDRFRIGNAAPVTRPDLTVPAGPTVKSNEALIAEARRILGRIEQTSKSGDLTGTVKAEAALEAFTNSSERAAAAVKYVQAQVKTADKTVSQYGQTFDRLKGQLDVAQSLRDMGGAADAYLKSLDAVTRGARDAADAEKRRNGETDKYRQLLSLSGDAAKKAQAERERASREADADRKENERREKEAQDRLARINSLSRQGKIEAARLELTELERMRENDLRAAGQSAAQRLAVEKRYADRIYAARKSVLDREKADRDAAIRNNRDLTPALRQEQLTLSDRTYQEALADAGDTRSQRPADALDAQRRAVRSLRDEYAGLAGGMREKIEAGQVEAADLQAYLEGLEKLTRAAGEAGLAQDRYVQGARQSAEAIYQQGIDAQVAAGAFTDVTDSFDRAGRAGQAFTVTLEDALALLPAGEDATAAYMKVLEELAAEGKVAAETVTAVKQAVADRAVIWQLEAEEISRVTEESLAAADGLAELGDTEGAIGVLSGTLDGLYDRLEQGQDVADAISLVTDRLNELGAALNLGDEFNTFVAGLSGTVDEQIGQVVDRLEEVTDPAMRVRLQGLLKDLRADLPKYADPYAAGYLPGSTGFVLTGDAPDLEEVASARDLGTLLNETTDPAQVQALMGEVADLLAGEIGQRLPASVRTSLEEGVQGAQGYLDALSQITEDGVVDGWERAGKGAAANPLPENRFVDFSNQIFALGGDGLNDPTQYDALTASLQQARAESQLTEADLQNLLALIEELRNPKTPEVGKAFDLGQWQEDIRTMTDEFDSGQMTAEEYASGLRVASVKLNELADEAERMGNIKLAGQFRELAGSLRAMTPEIAGLLKGLGAVQEYAGHVQDLAGAFSALAEGTGNEDLAANLAGLGNLAGKVAALAGDIARIVANPADVGAWVGAITKIVSGIGEALNGHRKAYAEAERLRSDFNKRFTLLNGDDFAKTTVRSRGWLADTFGGGPEVKQVVDDFGLKIAQAIEGGVLGGIKNGMKQALTTGDWTNFSNTFRESAYSGVVDGLIEAVFNDALKDILAPGIKALTDAAKTPGADDDAAAVAAFEAGVIQAEQFLTQTGQALQPSLDRLRGNLGVTLSGNTGGVDTTGLSTLPEPIQFALATPLLEGVRGIKDAADMQKDAAATSKAAAELILATFKDGVKVTVQQGSSSYTSTTGALV
ncbi:phage tail tape measure protein [Deinococcus sp. ME38]|uniref:phage tail tape measure protein n=1 Tax=Deinococcus sp. ME38 TaxID=3400344 RepID=UPI003B5A781B